VVPFRVITGSDREETRRRDVETTARIGSRE
jgi:hypothetical protein